MEAWSDLRATTHLVIWTIGHSTRSFEEFFDLLAENRIQRLADVRHYATSRRVPWAPKSTLAGELHQPGNSFDHIEGLGGFFQTLGAGPEPGGREHRFFGYTGLQGCAGIPPGRDLLPPPP